MNIFIDSLNTGKIVKLLLFATLLLFTLSCSENEIDDFDFLIGTWKVENQNLYETWNRVDENELRGRGYRIVENQEVTFETLAIKLIDNQVVYEATVPEQNEGATIRFLLNPEIEARYSFENPDHDFPKKIQYLKISDNEIMVSVMGDEGEGFELKMIKQS
ncbi:MAG: DUF6265 family protein [Balneolaceae bacterium]|nr:DUF6265 family protein [Balneolaceae bacterium]